MKPHSELVVEVREELEEVFDPEWDETLEVYEAYVDLYDRFQVLRAYVEHVENQDFRRGHTNTSCPPLTRAMCTHYMQATKALEGFTTCDHEWVDATNSIVESGEMCLKCHAIRAAS